jgi:hypothetical protein
MDSPVRLMPPCSKCIARAHFGPGSAHLFVCASNVRHASIQPQFAAHLIRTQPDSRRHSAARVQFG